MEELEVEAFLKSMSAGSVDSATEFLDSMIGFSWDGMDRDEIDYIEFDVTRWGEESILLTYSSFGMVEIVRRDRLSFSLEVHPWDFRVFTVRSYGRLWCDIEILSILEAVEPFFHPPAKTKKIRRDRIVGRSLWLKLKEVKGRARSARELVDTMASGMVSGQQVVDLLGKIGVSISPARVLGWKAYYERKRGKMDKLVISMDTATVTLHVGNVPRHHYVLFDVSSRVFYDMYLVVNLTGKGVEARIEPVIRTYVRMFRN